MRRPHRAETYGTLIILLKSKLVIRAACNGTEKAPVIINAALFLIYRPGSGRRDPRNKRRGPRHQTRKKRAVARGEKLRILRK